MAFVKRQFPGISELLNSINTKIQNALLPSGAIVWFNRTTAPDGWAICDGENGTPDLIGRYPLGAKTRIGRKVSAGLPNITGSINIQYVEGYTGAFYRDGSSGSGGAYQAASGSKNVNRFDASRCDDIYGNSSTVTPPSVRLLPCMKL